MAYFVPDGQVIDALKQAAHRGVDVKVILPGFSDFRWYFTPVDPAMRSFAGACRFMSSTMLAACKKAVIDGVCPP